MTTEGVTKIAWLNRLQLLLNKVVRVFMVTPVIKEPWATFSSAAALLKPERIRPGINLALQFLLKGAKSIYSPVLILKHITLNEIFFSVGFQWAALTLTDMQLIAGWYFSFPWWYDLTLLNLGGHRIRKDTGNTFLGRWVYSQVIFLALFHSVGLLPFGILLHLKSVSNRKHFKS